jgi:D-lactate dehydrogenase (cytochrome)
MLIKKDQSTIQKYFEDSSGMTGSHADFVFIPSTETEIKDFLKDASANATPVTIAGANTSVAGNSLPFGGAVLSSEHFNSIGEVKVIDDDNALITVGAGVMLAKLRQYLAPLYWMYPPDPTEKNSTIGGNIVTNASGGRGLKFGNTRDWVNALKVVFADGSSADIARGQYIADDFGNIEFETSLGARKVVLPKYNLPRIKNAAGYYNYKNADLIDVLIGSDGTLCVVIQAELKLIRPYESVFGGIIFFDDRRKAWDFVVKAKAALSPMTLEYFDANALNLIKKDYPVIPENADAGILFEQDASLNNFDKLLDKWTYFIEQSGIDPANVWFASDEKEQEEFRKFRHKIPESVNEIVRKNKIPKVGTDCAVPEGKLPEFIEFCDKILKESGIFYLIFGHVGENHLHANIIASTKEEFEKCRAIYAKIAKFAVELGGTVSAEHGIGKIKHPFLEIMIGTAGMAEIARFKKSFDPSAILGRGNIIPESYL